ncbi:MAG: citrate synthase/methylcitrate synthase [Deltaproteobacteria bacterium]|nr:citrate synthase/methylcitrate synthase [Deltaproteobacteria bacterium]
MHTSAQLSTKESAPRIQQGLLGVLAGETSISKVDGEQGRLTVRGYSLEHFAPRFSFEEAASIVLWDRTEETFESRLRSERALDSHTVALLQAAVALGSSPMDALRMGVCSLSTSGDLTKDIFSVIAKTASITGTICALSQGGQVSQAAFAEPSHAGFLLHLLKGRASSPAAIRALNTYWNTVMDHGFNNSTFTARSVMSTGSDIVSAVTAAVGSLKGPLHGGAPGPALELIEESKARGNVEEVLREKLDRGERLMGFGHRQYKVRDPRAEVLQAAVRELASDDEAREFYSLSEEVERNAVSLLAEYKPGRKLHANVEFYTSILLKQLGVEPSMFTPLFACSRVVGWLGHCLEQIEVGKLIRPDCVYVGREAS